MKEIAESSPEAVGDDLIWGIRAIAREINRTERQTFHLAATRQIPVGKTGGRHVASRSALKAHFAVLVSGGAA